MADFVYFAFTLGVALQTSDVVITSPGIRRVVTVHCVAAFFFNLGVLALAINVLGRARRSTSSAGVGFLRRARGEDAAGDDQRRAGQA